MAVMIDTVQYLGVTLEGRPDDVHYIGWVGPRVGLGAVAKGNTIGNFKKRVNVCIRLSFDAIRVMNTRDRKSSQGYFQFGQHVVIKV
jgi:hypothetical protein